MEPEKAPNCQEIAEKEKQSWGHHVARFQAILQSCDHKDSMVLAQKHTDQWNRTENPEMDPGLLGPLMFAKAGKISSGKKAASSINGAGKTGQPHAEE